MVQQRIQKVSPRSLWACAVAACALWGCSPALNWRTVAVDGAGLTLALPCKPDHGTRAIPMGAQTVNISMVGCEAHGKMFAISWMEGQDPASIAPKLTLWHAAVRAQLGLPPAAPGTAAQEVPFVPNGALGVPQSVRMKAQGKRPDGGDVQADAVWFARIVQGRAQLLHGVVYSDKRDEGAADTFFQGIHLN
ncbi:hypothetical protein [Diaphorobacter sp.]|uniref:hypothetical protein n=1 Tax=Diaphorobacter sp. TaxID=1934310 RepID=UPI0028AA158D|nr:hypothetical protein [Diaphorobacter sp.]